MSARARGSGPARAGWWSDGDGAPWGRAPSAQGNQLRRMLLQNYLQNRKSSSRGELPDPVGTGQYCRPTTTGPGALPSVPLPPSFPHTGSPTPGLDQDWSAIAATQCRLDKEGATKLVCDLITSTKNEKIFQESIGLAIRLLDGGNTEIQVWSGWACWGSPLGGTSCSTEVRCATLLRGWGLAAGLGAGGQQESGDAWAPPAPITAPTSRGLFLPAQTVLLKPGPSLSPLHAAHITSIVPASRSLLRLPSLLFHVPLSLWCQPKDCLL